MSLPVCAWRNSGRSLIARHYLWVNATFVLVALLWVGRNFIVADTLTLSSIASVNLYFHRAAAVEARVQGKSAEDVRAEWERQFESLSADWSDEAKLEWLKQRARRVIAEHPLTYVQITIDGFVYMMQSEPLELRRLLGLREGRRPTMPPASPPRFSCGWSTRPPCSACWQRRAMASAGARRSCR